MRILCLNRFVPPDPAPTAKLVGELGQVLEQKGWEVGWIGCRRNYREHRGRGWRRWVREAGAHGRMLWKGLFSQRPDVVLCLSDPPGLAFTAWLVARRWRAPLVHWAMDVYPEVAAAVGEVRSSSLACRLMHAAMRAAYARCSLVVCLDDDMVEALGLRNDPRTFVCPPWPPRDLIMEARCHSPVAPGEGRVRWLYSGNLGRAHDYATLLEAQKILETAGAPFDLVFQGGGAAREEAMQRARELGLKHCGWADYTAPSCLLDSLLQAHVLVATQRPEVQGLVWPSKLAVMKMLPRAVAWVGPLNGAIARDLQSPGSLNGIFAPGDAAGLAAWLRAHEASFRDSMAEPWMAESLKKPWLEHVEGSAILWDHRLRDLTGGVHSHALQPA